MHIVGDNNFLVNMFSRLPCLNNNNTLPDAPSKRESSVATFYFILDSNKLLECFLNLPDADNLPFALDLEGITQVQNNDPALWQRQLTHPLQYPKQQFGNTHVLSFQPAPNAPWNICILTQQLKDVSNGFILPSITVDYAGF
jgi:hypothetical protein